MSLGWSPSNPEHSDRHNGQRCRLPQRGPEFASLEDLRTRLREPGITPSADEERFLARWISGSGGPGVFPTSREILIRNIFRAAARYPDPSGSDSGSGAVLCELTESIHYRSQARSFARIPGKTFLFQQIETDLAARSRYREASILNPYKPLQDLATYEKTFGARLAAASCCPLCSHLAQGFDQVTQGGLSQSVFVALGQEYALIPNRFPPAPGPFDLLLLSLSHDVVRQESASHAVTVQDLLVVQETCRALGMMAQRNHALDGMTVPQHDHWKLSPLELPAGRWNELARYALAEAGDQDVWYGPLPGTPFDTLAITGADTPGVSQKVAELIKRLDAHGEVFTVWCASGVFGISPRWSAALKGKPEHPPLGSHLATHSSVVGDGVAPRRTEQLVPLSGEFGWERFMRELDLAQGAAPNPTLKPVCSVSVLWRDEVPSSLAGRTAVVIDVLAATTNIVDFLDAGAELYLTSNATVERDLQTLRDAGKDPILVGETLNPELQARLTFRCSNEPTEIRSSGLLTSIDGKTLLYMSNNGTRVVSDALNRGASRVIAASFANVGSVARVLQAEPGTTIIIPSGEIQFPHECREGEDFECAQYLAQLARGNTPPIERYVETARVYIEREYPVLFPPERKETAAADLAAYSDIVLVPERSQVVPVCGRDSETGLIRAAKGVEPSYGTDRSG